MAKHRISFVTSGKTDVSHVEEGLAGLDYDLDIHVCSSQGEVIEAIKGADVIINRGVPMPREVIEEIDTAKAVVSIGHGFDRVDDDAATDEGVIVANTAGFVTEEVANHTIMLLLACAKNLVGLNNAMKAGEWASSDALGRRMPLIYGEVFGLVGMGNIGRATVRRAQAFGLDVAVYDPFLPTWTAQEYRIRLVDSLEELASQADYVAILTPLNPHTRKLLGASFFRAMKPTAYFINCCRGRDRGRGGADRRAAEQGDRGGRPGRIRAGAHAAGQPVAEDGQRDRHAAYGRRVGRGVHRGGETPRRGDRAHSEGDVAHVAG